MEQHFSCYRNSHVLPCRLTVSCHRGPELYSKAEKHFTFVCSRFTVQITHYHAAAITDYAVPLLTFLSSLMCTKCRSRSSSQINTLLILSLRRASAHNLWPYELWTARMGKGRNICINRPTADLSFFHYSRTTF